MRQPKEAKAKKVKNQKTNVFGETIGRLHLDRQDLSDLKGKAIKTLRVAEAREKAEEAAALEAELRGEVVQEGNERKRDLGYDPEEEENGEDRAEKVYSTRTGVKNKRRSKRRREGNH